MINRLIYWKRIFSTYILRGKNNLSFWHGEPKVNDLANYHELDQYYMRFHSKAKYQGDYDKRNGYRHSTGTARCCAGDPACPAANGSVRVATG